MIKSVFSSILAASILSMCLAPVNAKESVTIKSEKVVPVEERTTTTTTPGDGVIIHTPEGSAAVIAPSTTTVETETRTGTPIVEKSVEVRKKKSNRHLLNVFGLFKVF